MSAVPLTPEELTTEPVLCEAMPTLIKETSEMLMYEELARARIRDLNEGTGVQRPHSALVTARLWHRMTRWAVERVLRVPV